MIDVATGDDLEAVTRHLVTLDRELARRRAVLAAANAEHLTAYNERHAPIARIVVLIDGFGGMVDALGDGGSVLSGPSEAWTERLLRVLVDGPAGRHPPGDRRRSSLRRADTAARGDLEPARAAPRRRDRPTPSTASGRRSRGRSSSGPDVVS